MSVVNFSFTVKEPQIAFALRTILEKFQVENIQETVIEDEAIEIPNHLLEELHRRTENMDRDALIDNKSVRQKARELCKR